MHDTIPGDRRLIDGTTARWLHLMPWYLLQATSSEREMAGALAAIDRVAYEPMARCGRCGSDAWTLKGRERSFRCMEASCRVWWTVRRGQVIILNGGNDGPV